MQQFQQFIRLKKNISLVFNKHTINKNTRNCTYPLPLHQSPFVSLCSNFAKFLVVYYVLGIDFLHILCTTEPTYFLQSKLHHLKINHKGGRGCWNLSIYLCSSLYKRNQKFSFCMLKVKS